MNILSQFFETTSTIASSSNNTGTISIKSDIDEKIVKAEFSVGDWVIFRVPGLTEIGKIEEVKTSGTVQDGDRELDASNDDPVYIMRLMTKDETTGEYKPTSDTAAKRDTQLKPFNPQKSEYFTKADNDLQVGDVVYLKFNDGYGEVVWRTTETVIVQEFDQNNDLVASRESYYIYNSYLSEPIGIEMPDEEMMYAEKSEQEVYSFDDCMFIKAEDGSLKVYGIYSSHYIDAEKDILTGESHMKFAKGVNEGKYKYPDIYIAHIPTWNVGKCEMIDYDERGFAVFGGTIDKEWQPVVEEIISKSIDAGINLGLSHGFMKSTVVYDDDGFITNYVSHEVSILPLDKIHIDKSGKEHTLISASNKYTALLAE